MDREKLKLVVAILALCGVAALWIGDRPIALIAVVDGKGFRRINDTLAPILKHTRGQTFFLGNLDQLAKVPAIARLKRR